MKLEGVVKVQSDVPGPTIAIFGGVHGDERAGIEVVGDLQKKLAIDRGTVYLVLANPKALKQRKRFTENNLNRLFRPDAEGDTYEHFRARALTSLLDECEALLDLHEHKDDSLSSFLICEPPSFTVAEAIGAAVISYGWVTAEPGGTDSYMFNLGKVGVCYEAGSLSTHKDNVRRHRQAVENFLKATGIRSGKPTPMVPKERIRYVKALYSIIKRHQDFTFSRNFYSFEPLIPEKVFARDGSKEYIAEKNQLIIFPRPQNPIGTEACIIGEVLGEYKSGLEH